MNNKKILSGATALAIAGSLALAVPVFADDANVSVQLGGGANQPQIQPGGPMMPAGMMGHGQGGGMRGGMGMGGMGMKPGVFGTVSSIDGTTIVVNGRTGFSSTTPTTSYTVDASNATVRKNNATTTLSSVAVGDTVMVQGTVSGTDVTATAIRDGVMMRMGRPGMNNPGGPNSSSSMPVIGNGQPVVGGTISAINGSTLSITTQSNVTYTVDASNAKILGGQNSQTAASLSSLTVGDTVVVQGTVDGTSVTASSVMDQSIAPTSNGNAQNPPRSFFGSIGHFFLHLFGF